MHFPCWQAHRSLKTGSLCIVLSSSASKCRESVSRKNAVLDQQEFGRVDQGEAAFPLQEGKHRCNWLAPAKRRVADIGGVIPRPAQSLPRAPVPSVRLPWTPGSLCPRLNAYGTADTSGQSNICLSTRMLRSFGRSSFRNSVRWWSFRRSVDSITDRNAGQPSLPVLSYT
jgi:hypothetical protein